MGFGPWEVVIILVILVIIFGAGRLTNVSSALGRGVREFKTAVQEEPKDATPTAPAAPPVICAACGAANSAGKKFCSSCGSTLAGPEAATAATTSTLPASSAAPGAATPVSPATTGSPATSGSPATTEPSSAPVDIATTPAAQPTQAENVCPSCATHNPVGQLFCGQCGTRLTRAA